MENGEDGQGVPKGKLLEIYVDFMRRIAKFDDLVTVGSRLLVGFRQALGFLGRPAMEKSALLDRIMQANGTKRFISYVEAGCVNSTDSVKNVSQSKIVLTEVKCLIDDVVPIVQRTKEQHEDVNHTSDVNDLSLSSRPSKPEVVDCAAMMAFIYSMVKQDYTMQDMIVASLSLKSSQGELDTYCQMWSLRPYIDDDVMHQAWSLIR